MTKGAPTGQVDTYKNEGYTIGANTNGKDISGLTQHGKLGPVSGHTKGHTKEQITKSYISEGTLKENINNGTTIQEGTGTLAKTIDKVQELTKDEGHDFGGTIGNLNPIDDVTKKIDDIKGLGETVTAVKRVKNAVEDGATSMIGGGQDEFIKKTVNFPKLGQRKKRLAVKPPRLDMKNNKIVK